MRRNKLIQRREKMKLTQQQVADRAGIARAHYSQIELGILDSITLKTAVAIGKALNYNVDIKGIFDIYYDEDEEGGDE